MESALATLKQQHDNALAQYQDARTDAAKAYWQGFVEATAAAILAITEPA